MEQSIISAIQNGDRQAFHELYDLYFDYAMRVATAVMKHDANAADAVQETFIRVYQYIDHYEPKKPFKPWFYRILINECKRIFARAGKVIAVEEIEEVGTQELNPLEQFDDLYEAIQSLKDHQRIPVILKYLHGLTEKEIAATLDLNVNTVKSRLFKARSQLKTVLEKLVEKEGLS